MVIAVVASFLYTERGSALLATLMFQSDRTEDEFVNNVLLDLGKLSDETISPKVFFLDVPILTYHQVRPITEKDNEDFRRFITSPEEFDRQLQYLKELGFTVVSLKDVVAHLASSSPLKGKYVAITFDDGYQSQYHYALSILKKYNDTATFFVYTDAVDRLKQTMTWDEIIDLDSQGMIIAAHTRTHPLLTKIDNKNQLSQEIYGSKEDLETHLHKSVTLFAYPYGNIVMPLLQR